MSQPQIEDHDYQEDDNIEDLSALLDDALQDFETQKSYNKGKGKQSRSKTGPPSSSMSEHLICDKHLKIIVQT